MKKVELLAPAGSREAVVAAIQNDADAVYLGFMKFGARAYASNFTEAELIEVIRYVHLYGKKVYVTVNTIIYESEIAELITLLDFLYLNDVDAIITQDVGIATIVGHRYPDFALHASTQMNVKTLEEARVLKDLGYTRVILGRETSIEEVKRIKEHVDIEVEVFVHGALCVSYSGNCYISSLIGKRSGNRGRCAQPCRLPYKLNGEEEKYLLSPKDLMTIQYVNQLIEAGIDSLKIEGRMKRSEYVAGVVSSYKKAINDYYAKHVSSYEKEIHELKLLFNRSFTKGFLFHEKNQDFANPNSSNHIGVYIGKVISTNKNMITVRLEEELRRDDGIRIVGDQTDGIIVNQIYKNNELVQEAYPKDVVSLRCHMNINVGAQVYKTTSSKQLNDLRSTFEKQSLKIPIKGILRLEKHKLSLTLLDGLHSVTVYSSLVEEGINPEFIERILNQLYKLNDTPFLLRELKNEVIEPIFLPIKEINALRRDAINKLSKQREVKYPSRQIQISEYAKTMFTATAPILVARVREEGQLLSVVESGVKEIYIHSLPLYLKYKDKLGEVQVYYYSSRMDTVRKENTVSSSIANIKGNPGSIYMNVVNSYALYTLFQLQAKSVGLSLELTGTQIKEILEGYQEKFGTAGNVEMMVYGRVEMMIMKYCLINHYYDEKNMYCNRCVKDLNYLTDRKGVDYPLVRDHYCNLIMLQDRPTHLLEYIPEIISYGVNRLLLDFTVETKEEVLKITEAYINKLQGKRKEYKWNAYTIGHFKEGVE